ncbi:MAG: DHHA1 domain-containing protein [Candidatus Omnitrophica bacterium]|nr:DHHA1 domain-containing protein [Candidatus Omnitrophota bacterium]
MNKAVRQILAAKSIVIAGHINPDGDCIGSLLSLGLGLETLGKRVYMLSSDGVPLRYRYLPGAGRILRKTDKRCDIAISVDCGRKEMLAGAYSAFEKARCIIEIDHHAFRVPFGDLFIIDIHAACVGEIIYKLLKLLGVTVNKNIAENILTSVIVETNSFRLPKVRPFTFEVCSRLIEAGADFYSLVDRVFWSQSRQAAVLSGSCLARCKFMENGKIAWSIARRADMEKVSGRDADVDTVADTIRSIKGVEIAILFREKNKRRLRVSLRSKGRINIAKLAERYGGGGHFDVAGCLINNTPKALKKFLSDAQELLLAQQSCCAPQV